MGFSVKQLEAHLSRQFFGGRTPSRPLLLALRCLILTCASAALANVLPDGLGELFRVMAWFFAVSLVVSLIWLVFRSLFTRIFWTVRSRLIVMCLLMGLAPIVLFGILGAVATYLFCGQFATSIAAERIDDGAGRALGYSASSLFLTMRSGTGVPLGSTGAKEPSPASARTGSAAIEAPTIKKIWYDGRLYENGKPVKDPGTSPFAEGPLPSWIQPGFRGVILEMGQLYLCGVSGDRTGEHTLTVLSCMSFRNEELEHLAEGLGTVRVTPNLITGVAADDDEDSDEIKTEVRKKRSLPHPFRDLAGGRLPAPVNLLDVRIYFSAPLPTTDWVTGKDKEDWLFVISRPAVLYKRLFASSVNAGRFVHIALISTSIVFAVLELMACFMAIALSRTITRSIADLYDATSEIDRGNLDHRIPVRRKDQLAALAGSFNTMTASLKGLLREQREKDRMENELKVAQEVQNNLFPHSAIALPNFELFGICQAARTIGGDYYDFIPFGTSQLYLALGDISGKGISAALLMASLHSAVRAYRTGATAEMLQSDLMPRVEMNVSPGQMLALLNAHLYTSTQASKYATLFLACYDSNTRELTYSNGGHLPPILLRTDGTLKRLECGGSVVGLLEGMQYEEETVQLGPGDLLIAYSDGLTEPEKDGVDFGEAGLIDVVRRNQILSLSEMAAHTLAAVETWIGEAEQPDDMTLVLARLIA